MVINQEIILIIIFIVVVYFNYKITKLEQKKIEGFDTAQNEAITTAVKKIYLADVEAIRILSNFAIQLSQGGFTVPGNINCNGTIKCTDTLSAGPNNEAFLNKNGTMFAQNGIRIGFAPASNHEGIFAGTKDGAKYNEYNMAIKSWYGIGFVPSYPDETDPTKPNNATIWFDLRTGTINCKKLNIVDDGNNTVLSIDGTSNGDIFTKKGRIDCASLWVGGETRTMFDPKGYFIGWYDNHLLMQGYEGCKFQYGNNTGNGLLGGWDRNVLYVNTNARLNVIGLAGYYVDLGNNQEKTIRPIICSMSRVEKNDAEDYFILNPGYRIQLYKDGDYKTGNTNDYYENYDNTGGISPKMFYDSNQNNQMYSYKVFFNNVEVKIDGIP